MGLGNPPVNKYGVFQNKHDHVNDDDDFNSKIHIIFLHKNHTHLDICFYDIDLQLNMYNGIMYWLQSNRKSKKHKCYKVNNDPEVDSVRCARKMSEADLRR